MATTFTLTSNAYSGRTMKLVGTITQQNIKDNYSIIEWELISQGGTSSYYTTGPTTVSAGGTTIFNIPRTSGNNFPSAKGSQKTTQKIYHNEDGTKSINVSLKTAIYTQTLSTKTGTFSLNRIIRYAELKSAPNLTDNDEDYSITYNIPVPDLSNTLYTIGIYAHPDDGEFDYLVPPTSIPKDGKSFTYPLSPAYINNMIQNVPENAKFCTIYFVLRTYLYGNIYGTSSLARTFTLVNGEPVFNWVEVIDTNTDTIDLTGDSDKLIKNHSNAGVNYWAYNDYGDNITYHITNGGHKYQNTTGYFEINAIEDPIITIKAVSSRGFSSIYTIDKSKEGNWIEYKDPTCFLNVNVTNPSAGKVDFIVSGYAFAGSFGLMSNYYERHLYYREIGATAWEHIELGGDPSGETVSLTLDYSKGYEAKTTVLDSINTTAIESDIQIINFEPIFYWNNTDFYFNSNVNLHYQDEYANLFNETFYKPEETFSLTNLYTAGTMTNAYKQILFSIPLRKSTKFVSGLNLSKLELTVRVGNGYAWGSGSSSSSVMASGTFKAPTITIVGGNCLNIKVDKITTFNGATTDNNSAVSIVCNITGTWR